MSEPTCIIPGCPNLQKARGWCRKHYTKWYRHGDPLHGEGGLPSMTGGVYSITCLANGWVYIGSSGRIRSRWNTHRSHLRCGRHRIPRLQADWDRYGEASFICELITVVEEIAERHLREQEHIDAAMATGKCYNQSPTAVDSSGYRLTAEQSVRLSQALKGKPKSVEHRANLWKNREATPEFRDQMSANGRMGKGKPKSPETRARMSAAQQLRKRVPLVKLGEDEVAEIKRRLALGEPGRSLAQEFGISEPTISQIKTGKRWADVKPAEPM
jgi:group I intron endonuclease